MEVDGDALIQNAQKVPKGAHVSVKRTEEGKGVPFKVMRYVQKVYTEEPTSVYLTEAVKGVLFPNALPVLEGKLLFVFDMVVGKDACLKDATRAHKVVPISARHTVVERDVVGVVMVRNMATNLKVLAIPQGASWVCAYTIGTLWRMREFMEVQLACGQRR